MAEIIRTYDLSSMLEIPSGINRVTVTALAEGLDESEHSIAIEYNNQYLVFYLNNDNTYSVVGIEEAYKETTACISIPRTYNDLPVRRIKEGAFKNNTVITEIFIPESIADIGNEAFMNCSKLGGLYFDDRDGGAYATPFLTIGQHAFSGCNFHNVTISKRVKNINDYSFAECVSLRYLTIPDSVTEIGTSAFEGCSLLESIEIPGSVTSIGDNAFCGCVMLGSVSIGDSVTRIGDGAFNNCENIVQIAIPSSVTYVGDNAFENCYLLERVAIAGAAWIGDGAFKGCGSLEKVYFGIPIYEEDTITGVSDVAKITRIGNEAFRGTILTDIRIPSTVVWIGMNAFRDVTTLESAVFEDVYGWFYTKDTSCTGGSPIKSESLLDSSYARVYMSVIAADSNWYKIDRMIAPTISLEGSILTITDSTGIAEEFRIYVNGWRSGSISVN